MEKTNSTHSLLYHTLKIMLHRPFIKTTPSSHDLHDLISPQTVHIQSATFSAIRITSIVNAYKNFYPLVRLVIPELNRLLSLPFSLSNCLAYLIPLHVPDRTPILILNCDLGDIIANQCQQFDTVISHASFQRQVDRRNPFTKVKKPL